MTSPARLEVAEEVRGDARIALAAVVVDVAAAAHGELDPRQPGGAALGQVGDAVEPEVLLLAELRAPGHDHADALAEEEGEIGAIDLEHQLAHLLLGASRA